MTDRHAGYIVCLMEDTREDDAEATLAALKQIKGVLSVEPIKSDINIALAEMRMRGDIAKAFYGFYNEITGRKD